jgi:hypothetical protein
VPLEVGLVDGDVLDPDRPLPSLQLDHLVDEKEGVAVGQDLEELADVQPRLLPPGGRAR